LSRSIVVEPPFDGSRLDYALVALCPEIGTRGRRRLCDTGRVYVQNRLASAALRVRAGQVITLEEPNRELPPPVLIAQKNNLVALNKPSGMASAHIDGGASALEDSLSKLFPLCVPPYPRLLNRLDTGTSGIVVAALTSEAEAFWRNSEQNGHILKHYFAVVEGKFPADSVRIIDNALDTDNRRITRVLETSAQLERTTRVEGIGAFTLPQNEASQELSLVGCTIMRGARHQIRAHLAHIGFPLYGDILYGGQGRGGFLLHHAQCTVGSFTACTLPDWFGAMLEQAKMWLKK